MGYPLKLTTKNCTICIMKVLFLAAGLANRLRPLTNKKTKTLIDLGGKSIMEHSLESLINRGFRDFVFVSGHGHEFLKEEIEALSKKLNFKYTIIFNPDFEKKNNSSSVLLALDHLDDHVLLINSDVVYDPTILDEVVDKFDTSLVIDDYKQLTEESMKVFVKDGHVTKINKALAIDESFGEYIGISILHKDTLPALKKALQKVVAETPHLYYENGYDLIFAQIPFKALSTKGKKWVEVDNHEDLVIARKLLKKAFK